MTDKKVKDDATEEPSEKNEESSDQSLPETPSQPSKPANKLQALWQKYLSHKKVTIPATVAIIIALVFAIPLTRYTILGLFIKQSYNVHIIDSATKKPISSVAVGLNGVATTTNAAGDASLKVKVGKTKLTAQKKYYKDFSQSVTVNLSKSKNNYQISMTATGRQVPVTITNKITGRGVASATVKAADTEAQTDKDGAAVIVLPADKDKVSAEISGAGYNTLAATITVTDQKVPANSFSVTPAGKLYFLSKASGKIDVVKTNLDGSGRATVLSGTGKEEDTNTVLLASRDWKYLALLARRDSDKPKLYLIDASNNDKLTTMDEGDATFELAGWNGSSFVYTVNRNKDAWISKDQALKSFNASNGQLKTLDETQGEGNNASDYAAESFGTVSISEGNIIYPKSWQASYYSSSRLSGKQGTISSIKPDGSNKQVLKSLGIPAGSSYTSFTVSVSKPDEIYYSYYTSASSQTTFYEYEDSKIKDSTGKDFQDSYPTYLISPDDKASFWSDPRDGKNSLFVGDSHGDNGKQIASLSEYLQYGWYTNDYLLVTKNSSELYVMPRDGGQVLKVSDYHKPVRTFAGYGGGYGGF